MWTYVIAYTEDLDEFMMVRSRKRGDWEMPGGRSIHGEKPLDTSKREFMEETGHELITREDLYTTLGEGFVHFGIIGPGDPSRRSTREILDVSLFSELPEDLAYPFEEYGPLIDLGRRLLS
jgi:8-oxo-dGTP pyrophosphatase MutT (NUDIX family)